ncbi:MAG: hypothetical protein ACM34L_14970 [Gemmatimonas sp.]|nr:hypothetical protein [Gemmatimonadaceae bacterium]
MFIHDLAGNASGLTGALRAKVEEWSTERQQRESHGHGQRNPRISSSQTSHRYHDGILHFLRKVVDPIVIKTGDAPVTIINFRGR